MFSCKIGRLHHKAGRCSFRALFNLPKTHFHDNHGGGHLLQTIVYNDRYDSNDRCILLT